MNLGDQTGGEVTLVGDGPTLGGSLSVSDPQAREGGLRRLFPGTAVGRYVVLEELGRGAMGVVYAAYDPRLDRRVALKILAALQAGPRATQRLQREARALARLSHPNVVAVHDVDQFEDSLFIAMEYVEGETLTQWLKHERTPTEILELFVAAGRGLAAAHRAQLVHRDFKPENVMVGHDARPRVMDFGVVHAGEREAPQLLELGQDSQATQFGTLIGTPAYMAPEQFEGAEVDARADQFSFCVALYRALYRQKPFAGDNIHSLTLSVTGGELVEPPVRKVVGARVRQALIRGLARDPDQRWPGMDALLDELEPAHARHARWRPALALGVALGTLTLAAVHTSRGLAEEAPLCRGAQAQLEPSWGEARRAELREHVLTIERPFAADVWAHIEREFDRWSSAWSEAHHEACAATRLRGEQSEALMDLRMRCLDRQHDAFAAAGEALASAGPDNLAELVELADQLPSVARCSDLDALEAAVPPPEDPGVRAELATLERELASLVALHRSGQVEGLDERLAALRERARPHDYAPLEQRLADFEGSRAWLVADYEQAYAAHLEAFRAAVRARDDYAAADHAIALIRTAAYELDNPKGAETWAEVANALCERAGRPSELEARRIMHEGIQAVAKEQRELAVTKLEAALKLAEAHTEDPQDIALAVLRTNLGSSLIKVGEPARAVELHSQAIAAYRANYGLRHPLIATLLLNLGNAHYQLGQLERTLELTREALEVRLAVFEPTHAEVLDARNNLAVLLESTGEFERALAEHQLILDARQQTLPPTNDRIAQSWSNLGATHERLGHNEQARHCYDQAIQLRVAAGGREQVRVADVLYNIGQSYMSEGDYASARAPFAEALELYRKLHPPTHPDIGWGATGLGRALVALGRMEEAEPYLREALALRDKEGGHPGLRAETRFALAQSVVGKSRQEARELALGAVADYEALGVGAKGLELERKALLDWVAAQGW